MSTAVPAHEAMAWPEIAKDLHEVAGRVRVIECGDVIYIGIVGRDGSFWSAVMPKEGRQLALDFERDRHAALARVEGRP